MFKRIKRLWELSKRDKKLVDRLTVEDVVNMPLDGDGRAEYLGEGTEQEFEDMKKKDAGIFGLFKGKEEL